MNALESLAKFVHDLSYDDIPEKTLERIRLSLADAAGCMVYGSRSELAHAVKEGLRPFAIAGGSKVFYENWRLPAPYAALVNGAMIASMAYDDLHHGATVHCGCIAVPAAMAALDLAAEPVSGREFLTALTAAYEAMIRVSYAIMPQVRTRGYHPASVAAPFCAAAAAARILKLNEEQTLHALGIAGVFGSGLMSCQLSSNIHGMQAPYNAMHGLNAAIMSRQGVLGTRELFDDTYGAFLNTIAGHTDTSSIEGAGKGRFECTDIGIKFYPTAGSVSSALDGITALAEENGIACRDIEDVTVRVNKSVFLHCGFEYTPGPVSGAQMNIAYCAAALLERGRVTAAEFEPDVIMDPAIAARMACIHVVHDESMDNLGKDYGYCARIEARACGKVLHKEIVHPRGSAGNPLSEADVLQKFLAQCAKVCSEEQARELFAALTGIGSADDVRTVLAKIA